ncbi:c-type cytochrome [Actinocrinis puniceicyclus]|uniref:Cytochrome bc1 complex cytochrome c subunit n=1 Tax=Actinocrinis puniceicyclus TaxID=977794 RepID=A0A8J7WJI3_9ACTN|nr:cytochrome c [Actinocrinis puniceicyclus]MBS2963448.1 c-type cytochrome [Actinocrinis puniceicyclus]
MKSLSTRRRHPLAAFVVLALGLAFAGTLFAAFVSPAASADTGESAAQQLANGKALYISSCSSCHGKNAEGTGLGPSLVGVGAASVDFQVSTGRMPAKQLGAQVEAKQNIFSTQQIQDMAAYVQSLGGGPQIPAAGQYAYDANAVALGGQLFRENCSQCHNFAGEGGALTDGKFAPKLTQTNPQQIYEAMLTGPQNMPVFSDKVIPPAEKQAIISYLLNSRNEPNYGGAGLGRLGPVSEGLFIWTVGLIALLLCAVWIAAHTTKASAQKAAQAAAAGKAGK